MLHYPIVLLNALSSIFLPIISGHPILQNIREVSTIHTATFGHHALGHGPLFLQVLATATGREMMSDDHLRRHWEKNSADLGTTPFGSVIESNGCFYLQFCVKEAQNLVET